MEVLPLQEAIRAILGQDASFLLQESGIMVNWQQITLWWRTATGHRGGLPDRAAPAVSDLGFPTEFAAPRDCCHVWESVSMVFETQLLDECGRVQVRQPDIHEGRVYFICRGCASHTYMTTQWLGARMYGSEDVLDHERPGFGCDGYGRPSWRVGDEEGARSDR